MPRSFTFRILTAVVCLLALAGHVTAAEVDCDSHYCFSPVDFSGDAQPEGICITALPESCAGTLMLGSRKITQAITDNNGNYEFKDCLQGTYNLVAELNGIKKTVKVVLGHSDQTALEINLPAVKTNTAVSVQPGSPAVVVGGLDDMMTDTQNSVVTEAEKAIVAEGGEVEIKMDVKENPAPAKKSEIDEAVEEKLNDSAAVELYVDLDLTKTVRNAEGTVTSSEAVAETHVLLENIIFLPGHLQGKDVYHVFRQHGDTVEEMARLTAPDNGEGFMVNGDKTAITIYSQQYSTFAIVTTEFLTITFDMDCDYIDILLNKKHIVPA